MLKCLMFVLFALASVQAQARLGGVEGSIDDDSRRLHGENLHRTEMKAQSQGLKVAASTTYAVHEMQSNGTTIKEFVSSDGTVFAVTWEGTQNPDLEVLLGDYKKTYDSAFSKRIAGDHRHVMVQTDRLVVQRRGHSPHLTGVAYDPKLLPAGLSAQELK